MNTNHIVFLKKHYNDITILLLFVKVLLLQRMSTIISSNSIIIFHSLFGLCSLRFFEVSSISCQYSIKASESL